jgi:hypothetical protein
VIEIRNEKGRTLQLPMGEKLSVELISTILNTDQVLQGSYSYPFRFPLNEHNLSWLGGGATAEQLARRDYAVHLYAEGIPLERGAMSYRVSGKYANAYLKLDLGEVAGKLRELRLRDLMNERYPLGSSLVDVWRKLDELTQAAPGVAPLVFPPFRNELMVEPEFVGAPASGYERQVVFNRYRPWVNVLQPGPMVPAFFGGAGHLVNPLAHQHRHGLVPMLSLVYVLRRFAQKLGFTAMGEWLSDTEVNKLILFNTQVMPDIPATAWNNASAALPGGTYYVEMGRHVPDMSVGDFIKALRGWMGVGIFFNSKTRSVRFKAYRTMKNESSYQDFTQGFIPDTDQYDTPDKTGYTLTNYREDGDELLKETAYYRTEFTVGDGSDPIELGVGTCLMYRGSNSDSSALVAWTIPQVKQSGNLADEFFTDSKNYSPYREGESSENIPAPKHRFGLRLLLYHGLQPDASGLTRYPLASSVSYNFEYETVGGLSLLPGEPDDVYAQYQRYYYEMLLSSERVQLDLMVKLIQVQGFQPERAVGLRLRNRVFSKWLPERITYQLPARNGVVRCRMQAVQLIPVNLKPTVPEGTLYNAVWVWLTEENYTDDQAGFNYRYDRYDIAVYFYEKGNKTSPVDMPSLLINYRRRTQEFDENGQAQQDDITDLTATASGLKYLLQTQTITREEVGYEDPQNPQIQSYRVTKQITYTLLPGTGYRVVV